MHIQIHKAQRIIGSEPTQDLSIHAKEEIPAFKTLAENDSFFMFEASQIETALHNSLPGGTYDRVLGLMLQRKATHFRVAHQVQS